MPNAFNSGTAPQIVSLLETIASALGITIDLTNSAPFSMELSSPDGKYVNCIVEADTIHPPAGVVAPGAGLLAAKALGIPAGAISVPASGGADLDGTVGTAVLVASTVTVPVATPNGSTVYATVTTPGGAVKQLSAVQADASHITISSPGSGYGALLESAGAAGTLVLGTVDIALANAVGDRLAVALVGALGTAGILSVARKNNTQVTVTSWVASTGVQTLDVSNVKAYNFGQASDETSTVRWAVIRP